MGLNLMTLTELKIDLWLTPKFSEMVPLFVIQEIPDCNIPGVMKMYKEKAVRKTIKETKKLLGVMKAKKIFLYTPMIH